MVLLVAPLDTEDRYFMFYNFMIGPYDPFMKFEGEVIDLPSDMQSMEESRGIWHENNVLHTKVEGELQYHPLLSGASRSPTTGYPMYQDRVSFPVYDAPGNPQTKFALNGFADDQAYSFQKTTSSTWLHYALEKGDGVTKLWTVYYFSGNSGTPPAPYSCYVYEMLRLNRMTTSGMLYFQLRTTVYKYPPRGWQGINWDSRLSFTVTKNAFAGLVVSSVSEREDYATWYRARVPDDHVFSPSRIKEHIDAISKQLVPEEFPVPEVPYGDLAMKASERSNANNVNMIAFLRDLRHPTEMIPKLRNLQKLKTIADDYLTVEYGILPTIGDIKSIVSAFKKMKPYLDRNGFSTYTAMASGTQESVDKTYYLEQRIKLAIGHEDNEFLALIQRLESWGTLPTCENIWDLVPYSFVVDWFIDVGGFLERIDTRLRLMRLDIRYATMSRTKHVSGRLAWDPENPYTGLVTWEQYHRWVSDQCPVPPLSLQSTSGDFNHWLESGALLLQRLKR